MNPFDAMPAALSVGALDRGALRDALRAASIALNPAAEELLADARFTPSHTVHRVTLAARTVASLGFADGASWRAMLDAARAHGLSECSLDTAVHLRLAWTAQPEGAVGFPPTTGRAPHGAVTVVSAPLDDGDDTPKGFYLRRIEGALWLRGYRSWEGHRWSPDDALVFAVGGATMV